MEEWRTIEQFPNYEVSNLGRVRRKIRVRVSKAGKILKATPDGQGYLRVNLFKNGTRYGRILHRLVAEAFLGKSVSQVNHKDGDKGNNLLENLEYLSPKENTNHAITILGKNKRGERNPRAKLKEEDISLIFELSKKGMNQTQIADKLNVSHQHISDILRGLRWRGAWKK
jgi:hypothetical protein